VGMMMFLSRQRSTVFFNTSSFTPLAGLAILSLRS
jgi:hypothetical protein